MSDMFIRNASMEVVLLCGDSEAFLHLLFLFNASDLGL